MYSYLESPPNSYIVQPSVSFQPPVQPLNSSTAFINSFPIWNTLHVSPCSFVLGVRVNNGGRPVLVTDYMPEFVAGVSAITNHVFGPKSAADDVPCLSKQGCGFVDVVKIALAGVHHDGQLVGGVAEDMDFVTKDVLFVALSVGFDAPPSVRVRNLPDLWFLTLLPIWLSFLAFFTPLDHALMSVPSIATDLPKSGRVS